MKRDALFFAKMSGLFMGYCHMYMDDEDERSYYKGKLDALKDIYESMCLEVNIKYSDDFITLTAVEDDHLLQHLFYARKE